MGSWPKIDRSEVRLAPLFLKALNEGELTMKKIKTDVHLALFQLECVFFLPFSDPLFLILGPLLGVTPKRWKETN